MLISLILFNLAQFSNICDILVTLLVSNLDNPVIDNSDEIIKIKWSHYDGNFLEIQNDQNEVRLVNIFSKKVEKMKEINERII